MALDMLSWSSGVNSLTVGGHLNHMLLLDIFDAAICNMPRLHRITHIASSDNTMPPWLFVSRYRLRVSTLRLDVLHESMLTLLGTNVDEERVSLFEP